MKRTCRLFILTLLLAVTVVGISLGQRWGRRRTRDLDLTDPVDRNGVPLWNLDKEFKQDTFTFARIHYTSLSDRGDWGKWRVDFPDSDLNFSFRLQQLTSLEVDPMGKVVRLTDPDLLDYPFIYVIEPGDMYLAEDEVLGLRHYLENGGFMMVDDFWGEQEWYQFYTQLKRVFPQKEPVELPLEHEIFHCVYELKVKPQVPSIRHAQSGHRTERYDAKEAHYRAVYDNDGRMMAIICHNTDLGDGWEREGEDHWYFKQFSEKYAYPMGINIVVYAMTH
ncbi:MAG TPA: DUF4159 domain-containing protein [Pirellulaceae bacterium]|nr:DUF4159 domain-containing protein [Pirellulaceae bacterium]